MRRYLPPSAVNGPVWLGVYTKAMMINRILTICAAVAAGVAGTSLARAQQGCGAEPEHQDRHRQHDRGEQKTEAGEHGHDFRLRS